MNTATFEKMFTKMVEIEHHIFQRLNLKKIGQKRADVAFLNKTTSEVTIPNEGTFVVKREGSFLDITKKD